MTYRRVAVLGGTFDPIHFGHIHLLHSVWEAVSLDALWLMPNALPPHRSPPIFDAETRFALCEASVHAWPQIVVQRFDLELPLPSYAVNTLRLLREREPNTSFLWIVGADAWQGLPRWYQWEELFTLTNWLVLERPGYGSTPPRDSPLWNAWQQRCDARTFFKKNAEGGNVLTLSVPQHPASSTVIREAWQEGRLESVREWLPVPVWRALIERKPSTICAEL